MRRSNESWGPHANRRCRGRTQRNIGPTSPRHDLLYRTTLLISPATAQLTGFCLWNNRRASGEPPLLPAFRPLPETQQVCGETLPRTLTRTEEFAMIANALLFTIVILLGY